MTLKKTSVLPSSFLTLPSLTSPETWFTAYTETPADSTVQLPEHCVMSLLCMAAAMSFRFPFLLTTSILS